MSVEAGCSVGEAGGRRGGLSTQGRFHHFSESGTRGSSVEAFGGRVFLGIGAAAAVGGGGGADAATGSFSAGSGAGDRVTLCSRWASICWYRYAFSFSKASCERALWRPTASAVSRKSAARAHPAANRKRLRYEHPLRTHSRCIGRREGSVSGSGKSSSAGPVSRDPADRRGAIFIRVSTASCNRCATMCLVRDSGSCTTGGHARHE